MSEKVTIELPDGLSRRARTLAAACNRRLEDAVIDWINRAVSEPEVATLPDDELLRLCDAMLEVNEQTGVGVAIGSRSVEGSGDGGLSGSGTIAGNGRAIVQGRCNRGAGGGWRLWRPASWRSKKSPSFISHSPVSPATSRSIPSPGSRSNPCTA